MKKVFFLVNSLDEFTFEDHLRRHGVEFEVGTALPPEDHAFAMVVLWSYRKIIPDISRIRNTVVFHSSDLPAGKGWAPIFNTITRKLDYYTITGILASDSVDAGDVVVKARFKMNVSYTATILRRWDDEICAILIKEMVAKFGGNRLVGKPQPGSENFYARRRPEQNEIDTTRPFSDAVDLLRACEVSHPAFFVYEGHRFQVTLKPETEPVFPGDLEIVWS